MSIDRRIVSILYFNGIEDVNTVEKFIGENQNYYEIVINGELRKLKIPGYEYEEDLLEFFTEKFEKPSKIENIKPEIFVKDEFAEVEKSVKENKNFVQHITETFEVITNIAEETFEDALQKNEDENKKFLEKVEVKKEVKKVEPKKIEPKKEPKKEVKKTVKKTDIKKVDNDIDDFINLA